MARSNGLRLGIGIAIVGLALWYVASIADLGVMARILSQADPWWTLACIPCVLLSHLVRARRWQTLLHPVHPDTGLWTAFNAVMIGYAANTIIPRSGELIRPFVYSRREGIPLATSISSVIVERVLDVIALLIGIVLVLGIEHDKVAAAIPNFSPTMLFGSLVLPLIVLLVLIGIVVFTSAGPAMINATVRRLHVRTADAMLSMLGSVRAGLSVITTPSLWFRLTIESVGVWVLYILPMWFVWLALPMQSYSAFSFVDGAIVLVVIAIGVTIAPTPGALGIYQSFAQAALMRIYGASPEEGLAFGVLAWLVNYGTALLSGGICLVIEMRGGLSMRDMMGRGRVERTNGR